MRLIDKIDGVYGLYYNNPKGLSTDEERSSEKFKEEKQVFFEFSDVFGEQTKRKYLDYFSKEI